MIIKSCRNIIYSSVVASFVLLTFASPTFAQQETTTTSRSESIKQSISEKIDAKRKTMMTKMEANKKTFTERINNISDEQKKSAVERINTAIQTMNEKKTTRWAEALDKLNGNLEILKTQTAELKSNGINTSNADLAITTAENDLLKASTAVENQSIKEYTITIGDETTLRSTIAPVVLQLKNDLKATLEVVITSKNSLEKAASLILELK